MKAFVVLFLSLICGLGFAQENDFNETAAEDSALINLLGYTLPEAFDTFGIPEEVFPMRGDYDWQDDVVFYYNNNLYLYWYKNRVWQIRADKRYSEPVLGVTIGMSQNEVIETLGDPFYQDKDSIIVMVADRGYPIRGRLFFKDNKLEDIYIYRADF